MSFAERQRRTGDAALFCLRYLLAELFATIGSAGLLFGGGRRDSSACFVAEET